MSQIKPTPLYEVPVTAENPCNCHSYNTGVGEIPSRVMIGPDGQEVCIDECIADTLQYLWDKGIATLSSCCGHGRIKPNIVLPQRFSKEDADQVRDLISHVDGRQYDLLSWHLINV